MANDNDNLATHPCQYRCRAGQDSDQTHMARVYSENYDNRQLQRFRSGEILPPPFLRRPYGGENSIHSEVGLEIPRRQILGYAISLPSMSLYTEHPCQLRSCFPFYRQKIAPDRRETGNSTLLPSAAIAGPNKSAVYQSVMHRISSRS